MKGDKVSLTHGYYLMHSFEMCLIGFKDKGENIFPENVQIKRFKEIMSKT